MPEHVADRVTELANMHRCLDAAAGVWNLLASRLEDRSHSFPAIHHDEVMAALAKVFPVPLAAPRQEATMISLANIINQFNVSTCGLFEFAHLLHHTVFDEELSDFH